MSPEWLTAIGTVGTFLVIAASAIAALLQLRHMRSGNQIAAYNECREVMDSPEFRTALHFIRSVLSERLKDPQVCEEIVRSGLAEEYGGVRLVANLLENMGLFVRNGMMDERIACGLWSGIATTSWNSLLPLIREIRAQVDPGVWTNFEYLVVISRNYTRRHPGGDYPKGIERLSLDEPV